MKTTVSRDEICDVANQRAIVPELVGILFRIVSIFVIAHFSLKTSSWVRMMVGSKATRLHYYQDYHSDRFFCWNKTARA